MSWRKRARETIRRVIAEHEEEPTSIDAEEDKKILLKKIDDAYPFGVRRYWPYKIWLEERAKARGELAGVADPADPLSRPCPACGRPKGKPCIDIETRKPATASHESRVSGGALGPLFAARPAP